MGWTSYNKMYCHTKPNGTIDRKAECDGLFYNDSRYNVIKSAMVGSVYYAAVRDNKTNDVIGWVVLTKTDKTDFYYKEMDETCGPYDCKCPKSILNLLTPTDNEFANEWRERCRKYHESQKDPKLFKNMSEGQQVLWTVASDGWSGGIKKGEIYAMTKVRKPHSNRYVWLLDDGRYVNPKYIKPDEYELSSLSNC